MMGFGSGLRWTMERRYSAVLVALVSVFITALDAVLLSSLTSLYSVFVASLRCLTFMFDFPFKPCIPFRIQKEDERHFMQILRARKRNRWLPTRRESKMILTCLTSLSLICKFAAPAFLYYPTNEPPTTSLGICKIC